MTLNWAIVVGATFVGPFYLLGLITWVPFTVSLAFICAGGLLTLMLRLPGLFRAARWRKLWVSDDEVGVNLRVARRDLGKILVASGMNASFETIFVYDSEGRLVLGSPMFPHPRWKWLRFLRKEGLPVDAEPWRPPIFFRPLRLYQLIRETESLTDSHGWGRDDAQ